MRVKRLLSLALASLLASLVVCLGCSHREPEPTLRAAFIDVGQGDAILLDRGATEVLIDGGPPGSAERLVRYLRGRVDGPLEAVVASHPHSDHIGGLPAVLKAYEVKRVWLSGGQEDSESCRAFAAAVQAEGAVVQALRRGESLAVGPLSFRVLHPQALSATPNEDSIVLELDYGEVLFLFTGDAGASAEAGMLQAGLVRRVAVLKAGHHGSRYSSSAAFLEAAGPEVAIYMAGEDNQYGHPHDETISALQDLGARVYGTDENGTIEVESDGQSYRVKTARQ